MVLLAGDASHSQLKKVERTLENRSIPRSRLGTRAILGAAVGRAPVSAVAVTGASFAKQVQLKLDLLAGGVSDEAEE
jgi:ribosomal protein L7Ae-like RNA K-turn-binding protein